MLHLFMGNCHDFTVFNGFIEKHNAKSSQIHDSEALIY